MSYQPEMIDEFTDYRSFVLEALSRMGRTQAELAISLGLSRSMISAILAGKKKLNPVLVSELTAFFGLNLSQGKILAAMVDLENPSRLARGNAWQVIAARQQYLGRSRPSTEMLQLADNWTLGVVFELAALDGFQPDPRWIARVTNPPISVEAAAAALRSLLRVGMLRADDEGQVTPGEMVWSDERIQDADASTAAVRNHKAWLRLSQQRIASAELSSTQIFSLSEGGFQQVLSTVLERQRVVIANIMEPLDEPEQVFHVGIQLFPVSDYTDS